jgi:hypothetical protein
MKRHLKIVETPTRINVGNLTQKLRRIRTELAQMVQQVDDALERIDTEERT